MMHLFNAVMLAVGSSSSASIIAKATPAAATGLAGAWWHAALRQRSNRHRSTRSCSTAQQMLSTQRSALNPMTLCNETPRECVHWNVP
jgi:hypothetical protein